MVSSSSGVSISEPVGAPPMVMTARWMAPLARGGGLRRIAIAALDRLDRRFVLGADEAAFDVQRPLAVDADEDAGAGDLGRIVADGPVLERRDGGLDLAEALIDLVGQLVGLRVLLLKRVLFGLQRGEAGVLLFGEIDRLAGEAAQTGGVAIGEVGGDRDPIPTLGPQRLGLGLELLDDQPIEQRRILQPAAIVMLEEVAHDHAAGGFVDVHADEPRAAVGGPDRALGELAADQIRLLVVGARYGVPDLFLASVVVGDGERHQLLQRHAVLGIDVEELVGDGGQAQALLHHGRGHEEPGGDLLVAKPLVAQRLEGAELVERMERDALDVLGQRILLGDATLAHHAGDRRGLRQALLLDQQFERPEAPAAGRDFEHAGLLAFGVENRPDAEALQERASGDVLGQFLDRDAGLHAPDVRLAEHQLIEGDVARGAEGDLLNGGSHVGFSATGGRKTLSRPPTRHEKPGLPLALFEAANPESRGSGKAAFRKPGQNHHAASRSSVIALASTESTRSGRNASR